MLYKLMHAIPYHTGNIYDSVLFANISLSVWLQSSVIEMLLDDDDDDEVVCQVYDNCSVFVPQRRSVSWNIVVA